MKTFPIFGKGKLFQVLRQLVGFEGATPAIRARQASKVARFLSNYNRIVNLYSPVFRPQGKEEAKKYAERAIVDSAFLPCTASLLCHIVGIGITSKEYGFAMLDEKED